MSRDAHRPAVVGGLGEFTRQVFAEIGVEHEIEFRFGSLETPADVARETAGADAVVIDYEVLNAGHMAAMAPSVKVIGYSGTGLDPIDVAAARERGITVVYQPGFATDEVADHTVALMLAALRGLKQADLVARSSWGDWRRVGRLRAMSDATVGLVGLGRIGTEILARLRPFGPRLIVFDPALSTAPAEAELARSLDELLAAADVVSLQVPLTAATRGLIDRRALATMKRDAILVNASRGGVVDEAALADALTSGTIAGAALDVVEHEPPAADAPILAAPNTLLTPHVAWFSEAAERRSRDNTLRSVVAVVLGEEVRHGVIA